MSKFYTNVHLFKNEVLLRGYENGERIKESIHYTPYLFEHNRTYEERGVDTPYRTIKGQPVYKKDFDSILDARQYSREFDGVGGKQIYGLQNYIYTFINDHYKGDIDYDPKQISVVTIDIETSAEGGFPNIETADKPLTAITLSKNGKIVTLGLKDYTPKKDNVHYFKCRDENHLLDMFLKVWQSEEFSPDVVTGWNIELFDIPYLVNRITRQLGSKSAKRMSPWALLDERKVEIMGKPYTIHVPVGINTLDYLQVYKKFSFQMQESYKLDHIAHIELGENKVDYSEYEGLDDLYNRNFEKYIDYNIHDVVLVERLEDKLKFIEQIFAIAYDGKVNFQDAFTSVRMWDVIIHNYLLDKGIVIPGIQVANKENSIVGAFVKDPHVGLHDWVVSFDLNSLYPHLIMQYNISPETYQGQLEGLSVDGILDGALGQHASTMKRDNVAIAASGCMFDRDYQGFLPALMQKMYNDRVTYKQMMLKAKQEYEHNKSYEVEKEIARCHNMQLAKKIQLNSAYGALSNIYFRWFDINLAESITKSGQLSIRWMEREINNYLNKVLKTENKDYVIACDTDSMYLDLGDFVEQTATGKSTEEVVNYLDKVAEQVFEPFIDKTYESLAQYVNAFDQKMKMKREAIANKGIWTAKKRYILNVWDNEGVRYAEPKLKVQGIEAVRSSTPAACRVSIKEALQVVMDSDNDGPIQEYIKDFREKFLKLDFEEVAFPRSVRGLAKYKDYSMIYQKGTPIHVRGALIYNHMINEHKLNNKYEMVGEGEKIKFCYLKMPNPARDNVISSPGVLPKEFDLNNYIDREKQFDKSFLEPIKTILDAIGWQTEKQSTLESFF